MSGGRNERAVDLWSKARRYASGELHAASTEDCLFKLAQCVSASHCRSSDGIFSYYSEVQSDSKVGFIVAVKEFLNQGRTFQIGEQKWTVQLRHMKEPTIRPADADGVLDIVIPLSKPTECSGFYTRPSTGETQYKRSAMVDEVEIPVSDSLDEFNTLELLAICNELFRRSAAGGAATQTTTPKNAPTGRVVPIESVLKRDGGSPSTESLDGKDVRAPKVFDHRKRF